MQEETGVVQGFAMQTTRSDWRRMSLLVSGSNFLWIPLTYSFSRGGTCPPVPTAYLIFLHSFLPSIKDVENQRWSLARLITRVPTGASGVENLLSERRFRALPSRVGRHHILVQCSSLREKPRCTAPWSGVYTVCAVSS